MPRSAGDVTGVQARDDSGFDQGGSGEYLDSKNSLFKGGAGRWAGWLVALVLGRWWNLRKRHQGCLCGCGLSACEEMKCSFLEEERVGAYQEFGLP